MNKQTSEPSHPMGIKPLPYGLTNFDRIRSENYYYIDKTSFIPALENIGSYLFFIRPRRFGKTLFISMLESYYDVTYKNRFEEFYQGTWISDHPTKERGEYLVLNFNFSGVNPDPAVNNDAFLSHVQDCVVDFTQKYEQYLSANPEKEFFTQKIKNSHIASDILSSLFYLCAGAHQKLYVFIDEYDNFANTILSEVGSGAYHKLTHGVGQFRAFFNVLKLGTTGTGAPVTRSLITGVSPITMDDVTSGYNIGKNVSLKPAFNSMLGFTDEDAVQMIEYYRSQGIITDSTSSLMEIFRQWYGNYLFSKKEVTRMYNPDMVLYFLDQYKETKEFPESLIDRNVRIDYEKLRHLIIIEKERNVTTNGNFVRLKEILEKGNIFAVVKDGFPLKSIADPDNFISLLFYFGLLTIQGSELDTLDLVIPNETIRHLFYEYIQMVYDETGIFSFAISKYTGLMKNMALKGEWRPLLEFITGQMKNSMSLRDLMIGEKAIQAFLNVYLGLSDLYVIHPEREANKGYADIIMEPFLAQYPDIQYAYMIELKYMKPGEAKKKPADREIQELVADAEDQLRQYALDEKLTKTLAKTTLIKLVLVFCGHEAVYINEMK